MLKFALIRRGLLAIVDKPLDAICMDDADDAGWFPINKLPKLAFDHQDIMAAAKKLQHKVPAPPVFTPYVKV